MSLGERGQVQEEMKISPDMKTVDNKSSTVQWYDGFILRRVGVKEKRTGIKMLEQFSYSLQMCHYFFVDMSRYSTATCRMQGCVHDKTAQC